MVFSDFKADGHNWITLASGSFYPDILTEACALYGPVLQLFGDLLHRSETSKRLFIEIAEVRDTWTRIQLARVFRKYVSPQTPVEMLKMKRAAAQIVERFGDAFRPIPEVQAAFDSRPSPDEAICAILWEYKDRGTKGYDLTERFFNVFRELHPSLPVKGPERAGRDILLGEVFANYPNPRRPADFVIFDTEGRTPLAIGFARYDSDRGGAQEDDRTGGYANARDEVLSFARHHGLALKVVFLNDGPGLLLGTMWDDYSRLEEIDPDHVMVLTLRMIQERLTAPWLLNPAEVR